MVPAALGRCGRFADGWLPSSCTPTEAVAARVVIDEAAAAAGRTISPEHFGVSLAYAGGPLDAGAALGRRPEGGGPGEVVPVGIHGLRTAAGGVPGGGVLQVRGPAPESPGSWRAELEALADAVLDLQT